MIDVFALFFAVEFSREISVSPRRSIECLLFSLSYPMAAMIYDLSFSPIVCSR